MAPQLLGPRSTPFISHAAYSDCPTMAGIILRAPDGSIIVTLTILSNTEGGPSLNDEGDTADDGAAAAAAIPRRAAMLAAAEGNRAAALTKQEESILSSRGADGHVGPFDRISFELCNAIGTTDNNNKTTLAFGCMLVDCVGVGRCFGFVVSTFTTDYEYRLDCRQ